MTTTNDVTPIRISGPAGLLAVVPSMLGFHPTNSLVLMCLSGGRRRVGPVARVDLAKGHDHAMAEHLTNHARNHADEVVVISYQNSRRRPPILDDLLSALARAGIDVMDAIVVRGGRARPALNAAMERAHPGVPVPDADDPQVRELAAAGALAGRSVLSDRDQLRRSIAGPRGARLTQAQEHVDRAAAGRLPTAGDTARPEGRTHGSPGADDADGSRRAADVQEHVLRIGPIPDDVEDLLERAFIQVGATGEVSVEVATALAVMLTDVLVRDAVLVRGVAEIDRPWLPMLIASATWTPDALAPPLCSVLAMVAYRHGDGALAQIAVDRCLTAEPGHSLAHLMIAIMSAGVRPEELERIACAELDPIEMDCDDLSCQHLVCDDLGYDNQEDNQEDNDSDDGDLEWGDQRYGDKEYDDPDSGLSQHFR
jgi:hypothetical protein